MNILVFSFGAFQKMKEGVMLHGKMRIWTLIIVLVIVSFASVVLGQENGERKVDLKSVFSKLVETPDGYKGKYEIEWAVYIFNENDGWVEVDSTNLNNFFFTLKVYDGKNGDPIILVDDKNQFSYKPSTPSSFVAPVSFEVSGRVKRENEVFDIIPSNRGGHVSPIPSGSLKKPTTISNWELGRWVVIPWYDYFPWGIGEKLSTHLPKDHKIPSESSYFNTVLQAKKAIDNSGVVGKLAASWIGVFGNLGFIVFFWGLGSVFFKSLFPVGLKDGASFVFSDSPFMKDPDQSENAWVAYSEDYKAFLNKWRWIIVEMNKRIIKALESENSPDLDSIYLQVWRTPIKRVSEEDAPSVPSGNVPESELSKVKEKCDLGELYSGKKMLQSLNCDFNSRLGHKKKPTARILEAGLKNMVNNGMTWGQASQEVDRAMEMRADQEIMGLRRKSLMEYLYFGAAVAPLLGLLGTVTGISQAFLDLIGESGPGKSLDPSAVIAELAPSINEALWTTVMGLIASILMLIGFHIMDYMFDVIQSKWAKLFVTITEDL